MWQMIKLILLVVVLNVIRYLVGGPIEAVTIMEPMHAVMPKFPAVFNNEFTTNDFLISFFYNFMLWMTAGLIFHLTYRSFKGNMISKSLQVYGLLCLFFISLAAVYMNHYTEAVQPFYRYSMLDALIVFSIVGLANGLLYPLFFKESRNT